VAIARVVGGDRGGADAGAPDRAGGVDLDGALLGRGVERVLVDASELAVDGGVARSEATDLVVDRAQRGGIG
jgi:hypothetical protein